LPLVGNLPPTSRRECVTEHAEFGAGGRSIVNGSQKHRVGTPGVEVAARERARVAERGVAVHRATNQTNAVRDTVEYGGVRVLSSDGIEDRITHSATGGSR